MHIFLADESVDYRIIVALKDKGFIIHPVIDLYPGSNDNEVLAYCIQNDFILITEDKDFGDLTIRLNKPHKGIILLRLSGLDILIKRELVANSFTKNHMEFKNSFSVLNSRKLRIRKY